MAKAESSTLAATYWSILPFSFGKNEFAKFRLSSCLEVVPLIDEPVDADYLEHDLAQRLKDSGARIELSVQIQSDPQSMPLDRATVRWDPVDSPFIPIADLIFPQQDIMVEKNKQYGENLAFNIWRATKDFQPQGSISRVRRSVYRASAQLRRTTNQVPDQEPKDY